MILSNRLLQPSYLVLALLFISPYSFAEDKKEVKNTPNPNDPSSIILQEGDLSVTRGEVQLMIKDMTFRQKRKFANKPGSLKGLVSSDLVLKKKAQEAVKLGLDKDPFIQWKIENAKQRILNRALLLEQKKKIVLPKDINLLAEQVYKTNPQQFVIKEKVKAAHILLKTNNKDPESIKEQHTKLEAIKKEIEQGLDFAEAAKKYSDDKSNAASGGVLNFFEHGQMVPSFDKAAFALKNKGDLSDIVKTRFGFHLIKLLERKEKSTRPFSEVKDKLVKIEKAKYIQTELAEYEKQFEIGKKATLYVPALDKIQKEIKDDVEKTLKKIGFKK